MEVMRTPDARFEGLEDWDFEPHYAPVSADDGDTLRVHYADEGPGNAVPIVLMHGGPTWGYLFRKMIPPLAAAGHRVVVPDLMGAGRSDKPASREHYSYAAHVAWMQAFVEALDLRDITLLGHDWGGLIGLRLVAAQPERFARVVACNTFLPRGPIPLEEAVKLRALQETLPVVHPREIGKLMAARDGPPGFLYFRKFLAEASELDLLDMMGSAQLDAKVQAGYAAPYPDQRYLEGVRMYPWMLPQFEDEPEAAPNRAAWERLQRFEKPFLTAFSEDDLVMFHMRKALQRKIAGAQGREHPTLPDAGHLSPENRPEELARIVLDFVAEGS